MKIKKSELKKVLSKVSLFVVGKGATAPETGLIKLEKNGDVIWFCSTDFVNVARASLIVEDDDGNDFSFALPYKNLQSASFMKNEDLTFSIKMEEKKVIIKDGKSQISLAITDESSFPKVAEFIEEGGSFSINSAVFLDSLKRVSFACDDNSSREFCRGVCVTTGENGLSLMATDGHRAVRNIKEGAFEETHAVLTAKCLKAISLFDNGDIEFNVNNTFVRVKSENYVIYCVMLACDYPDITRVFNVSPVSEFKVNRKELLDSLVLMSKTESIGVKLSYENGKLHIVSESNDNVIDDWCDCEIEKGESFELFVNRDYFNDIFKHATAENISIIFSGINSAICYDDKEGTYGALMPMR